MEDNKLYPDQMEEQTADQGTGADDFQREEQAAADEDHNGPYQNEASENEVSQNNEVYREDRPYQNDQSYQGGIYQNNAYQNNAYQNNAYQNNAYQKNPYQNNPYYDDYQNTGAGYQNASYYNGTFSDTGGQNYGGGYQQYNGAQPYQNTYQNFYQNGGQMELEEPVKISEWVLAMVLMMIPCVNIIMMFVWAFSGTEKKSKSNFFKAYLIFFGISLGVMLFVWIAIVFFAMMI